MQIKAKFKVNSVTQFEGNQEKVILQPVIGGSDENKDWSQYTPSGSLEMMITADGAVGVFKPGAEYYLTFDPAAK